MKATTSSSMEEQDHQQQSKTPCYRFIILLISKRRTWVFLFLIVYAILLSSSWNILRSVLSWYDANSPPSNSPNRDHTASGWPAMYTSVVLGAVFGVLSMAAALAVAVPATLVAWITVLVVLAVSGKPRKALVVEGRKLTAEISGFMVKILIKEGNVVAAVCAVLGYFALIRNKREEVVGISY